MYRHLAASHQFDRSLSLSGLVTAPLSPAAGDNPIAPPLPVCPELRHVHAEGGLWQQLAITSVSQFGRALAAECLLAGREPCDRCTRKLNLSMAALWLFFARQDEAVEELLGRWGTAEPGPPAGDLSTVSHENGRHPWMAVKAEALN
jgi:hypothetical protein